MTIRSHTKATITLHIVLSSDTNVTSPKFLILLCHHQILVNYSSSTDENNQRCTSIMMIVHTTKTRYSPNSTGIKSWIVIMTLYQHEHENWNMFILLLCKTSSLVQTLFPTVLIPICRHKKFIFHLNHFMNNRVCTAQFS